MLTERKTFSRSLAASATRGVRHGDDVVDDARSRGAPPPRPSAESRRRRPWGSCGVVKPGLPGSSRSGENARKKSRPHREPARLRGAGSRISSVVPGYVVDSSTTSCPGRSRRRDLASGGLDVGEVGLAVGRERRRHADQDGVGLGEAGEIARGPEAALAMQFFEDRVRKMSDVGAVRFERGHLVRIDIEAEDGKTRAGEPRDEREAHISQSDDSDGRGARADQLLEGPGSRDGGHSPPKLKIRT